MEQTRWERNGMGKGLRPITWAAIVGVLFAAATLIAIVVSAMSSLEHTCEVCMTFRGVTECREASGRSADEATRTATDNACAILGARGMTLSIECQNTRPASVACTKEGD
jgi:hypothetical protein